MPRIRTIKPEMFGDEKLAAMPVLDRFVFVGLIAMADDAGRLLDSVRAIDGFVFPLTDADTSRDALGRLAAAGLLLRYTSPSGQRLIQIAGWTKHQKVDHAGRHVLPAPSAEAFASHAEAPRETIAAVVEAPSRDPRETVATPSRSDLGPYTKDRRPSTVEHGPSAPAAVAAKRERSDVEPDGFAVAWAAYPARAGGNPRRSALQAYRARLAEGVSPDAILAGVERYAAYVRATGDIGGKYVKQAATFFGPDEHWTEAWVAPPRKLTREEQEDAATEARVAEQQRKLDEDAIWIAERLARRGAPMATNGTNGGHP